MRGETIVVFGVSGVGKTSSCRAFVARHPEYLHLSASELLRSAATVNPATLRTAPSDQILANQRLLPGALRARREGQWERPVLIDAHSVIDNDKEIVRIPVEVIQSLVPDGMVLLETAPEIVAARRSVPGSRRPRRSVSQIAHEAEVARQAVLGYASSLEVPLEIADLRAGDALIFEEKVAALKKRIHSLRAG